MTKLLLGALLLSTQAFAAPAVLECQTYRGNGDLRISVSDSSATLEVLRFDGDRNAYSLAKGETVNLPRGKEHHRDWARYEGVTKRKQNLTFSAQKRDLAGKGRFRANLFVSADWTDTTEVSLQLDCSSK